MSKFIDSIICEPTGQRKTGWYSRTFRKIKETVLPPDFNPGLQQFTFEAGYKEVFCCKAGMFDAAFKMAVRQLHECIYGEFRLKLMAVERAIYEHDEEAAFEAIQEIYREIDP